MVPSLGGLGALKPYGDSLGERNSELLRTWSLRTLTPLRGIQHWNFKSLVLVRAPSSGGLRAGWSHWLPFGWVALVQAGLGKQEGEGGPIQERSGPSLGRGALPG